MEDPETSFSLIFVEKMGEDDIKAIREGGYVCDRIVVQTQGEPTKSEQKVLTDLGVDMCYTPKTDAWLCKLETSVKDVDATWLLHGILAVLPTVVVASTSQFAKLRALKNIQQTFGSVFALREI